MSLRYKYKGLTSTGKRVSDSVVAENINQARKKLKSQNITLVSIEEDSLKKSFLSGSKISATEIEQSTNQLATLLENGVKINVAIEVLIDTSTTNSLSSLWRTVHKQVQSGKSLHESLKEFSDTFDVLYLEMVNIAEQTGTLPEVFRGLSDNLSFQRELKSKTIQALIYPMIIFGVCIIAIFAIFNFVIPNMESVFSSAENLPGYTQWLLDTSAFVTENNGMILLFALFIIFGFIGLWNNPNTQKKIQNILAILPLSKALVLKTEQIRFCSAMKLTLDSGISLSNAILLSNKTLSIENNKQQLELVRMKVDAGAPLAESLSESRVLDKISVSLIKVGEQSGTLDKSFNEVTNRIKANFESWIMKMTSLLEPLLILVMGAIVGGVVVVMLLSIVSVNDISF
ncbi:type II secretion system F family protein [Thalassotalea profundi]|uniref:Type II secretion system protein F n=1 Tax=Thalassotalea profundi TaxID=2036687 RepID=A0ABQ3IDQ4_9GAMM|nr:type II secretion system F family protein [Thalassotalea profundi]GHE80640.1 type II secretion system protein F [Thalassotalea profundi]